METRSPLPGNANLAARNLSHKKSEVDSALVKFQANSRVAHITIAISPDACSPGRDIQGTYHKDMTPEIPVETCSRPGGCNCQYIPVLKDIFP